MLFLGNFLGFYTPFLWHFPQLCFLKCPLLGHFNFFLCLKETCVPSFFQFSDPNCLVLVLLNPYQFSSAPQPKPPQPPYNLKINTLPPLKTKIFTNINHVTFFHLLNLSATCLSSPSQTIPLSSIFPSSRMDSTSFPPPLPSPSICTLYIKVW